MQFRIVSTVPSIGTWQRVTTATIVILLVSAYFRCIF